MSFQTDVRDELIAVIDAASTDFQYIFRGATAQRISWRTLMEHGDSGILPDITAPFCVIEFGELSAADGWGDANDAYEWGMSIYGVFPRQVGGVGLTETEVEDKMMDWAQGLRDALRSTTNLTFQVIKSSSSHATSIPPNAYFLRCKLPLAAIQVTTKLICGESP